MGKSNKEIDWEIFQFVFVAIAALFFWLFKDNPGIAGIVIVIGAIIVAVFLYNPV